MTKYIVIYRVKNGNEITRRCYIFTTLKSAKRFLSMIKKVDNVKYITIYKGEPICDQMNYQTKSI